KFDVAGKVERLEYDPNRTSFIALIKYADGEQAYIIAPQRLSVGDEVIAGVQVDVKPGNAMPLANIPVGTIVHNVEMKIGRGGAIARSAGTYAQIVSRDQGYVSLRLSSGEQRLIHGHCFASIGAVSNPDHMNASLGKAGRNRWLGQRPHNRGVSMNPVDQGDRQVHRRVAARAQEERLSHDPLDLEGAVRGRLSLEEGRHRARVGPLRHHQDLEPALDHP